MVGSRSSTNTSVWYNSLTTRASVRWSVLLHKRQGEPALVKTSSQFQQEYRISTHVIPPIGSVERYSRCRCSSSHASR